MSELVGNTEVKIGSERSFGIVFAVVFLIIALWPLLDDGGVRWWSAAISGGFLGVGLFAPQILRPLNRLWFRFGLLLNKIVSPIIMGILFFVTVTPIGLLRRLGNGDPLNQKIDREAETYWIAIDPEKSAQSSMRKQF